MVDNWNDFNIPKIRYVKALNSHFVVFQKKAKSRRGIPQLIKESQSGLYCAEIDFSELEASGDKLNQYIRNLSGNELKAIVEYTSTQYSDLFPWEVKGNDHILAASYVLEEDSANYTARLMALTDTSGKFGICDEILDGPQVLTIEVIIPFDDSDRAYALYGTIDGINGSRH